MSSGATAEVMLPPVIDVTAAPAVLESLRWALHEQRGLKIDGSEVQEIGTAGIQMLIAAAIALEKRGEQLELHAPSDEILAAAQELGLYGALFTRAVMT